MSKTNGHRYSCECWQCRGEEPKGALAEAQKEIESLKAITELAVKSLEQIGECRHFIDCVNIAIHTISEIERLSQ